MSANHKYWPVLWAVFLFLNPSPFVLAQASRLATNTSSDDSLDWYIQFFEKVYETMEKNYYQPVSRQDYENFVEKFKTGIFSQLKGEGRSSNYVRWRAAALLVEKLKSPEDSFSAFFPPKFAKTFSKEVLGQKVDLGIEGRLTKEGYLVSRVEPRSDAYQRGLSENDLILRIDKKSVIKLDEKEIVELLTPLIDTSVMVEFRSAKDGLKKSVGLKSQEYFKQTVFPQPVAIPYVFCLKINSFNRKTSEDLFRFLPAIESQGETGLILDLRGNPGGPPLAAREISSFFLTPGEEFAYFQKTGQAKAALDVPTIPDQYHYRGPIVILVNKESGSAAELFSGVMQKRNRATLIGTNTAGKVLLKSMFNFDDESMVLLVTSRGYYPDGSAFSFNGVVPDHMMDESNRDWAEYAATYLASVLKKKSTSPEFKEIH